MTYYVHGFCTHGEVYQVRDGRIASVFGAQPGS